MLVFCIFLLLVSFLGFITSLVLFDEATSTKVLCVVRNISLIVTLTSGAHLILKYLVRDSPSYPYLFCVLTLSALNFLTFLRTKKLLKGRIIGEIPYKKFKKEP